MFGPLFLLPLFVPHARAEITAATETVLNAAVLDVTGEGLSELGAIAANQLPTETEIADQSESGSVWIGDYSYSLRDAWLGAEVTGTELTAQDAGVLELTLNADLWVNTADAPFLLEFDILGYEDTCQGYVEPFAATLQTSVGLDIVKNAEGNPAVDATVSEVTAEHSLDNDNIQMLDCSLDTVEQVLNAVGLSLYDLLVDAAEVALNEEAEALDEDLEEDIERALDNLIVEEEFDVEGATFTARLVASEIAITSDGVRLFSDGHVAANKNAACVADLDPGGSQAVASDSPLANSAEGHDAAVFLSDELTNQALYALWLGGALCYSVTEEELGFPIDTTLLSMVVDDTFESLFPEPAPMEVYLRPESPPEVVFGSDHALAGEMDDLTIGFFAEVDHRVTQVLGMNVEAALGVDIELDGKTGEAAVTVGLDTEQMVYAAAHNDFFPEADTEIEAGFAAFFENFMVELLADSLEDTVFTLDAMDGYGINHLVVEAAGSEGDWGAAYLGIGEVSYGTGGCDGTSDESGCSSGCSGGCGLFGGDSGRGSGNGLWFVFPLGLWVFRRQRHL